MTFLETSKQWNIQKSKASWWMAFMDIRNISNHSPVICKPTQEINKQWKAAFYSGNFLPMWDFPFCGPWTESGHFGYVQTGFCYVAKVAPVQSEQELMFCCSEEIVPKHSQCEQKLYPSHNLRRSLVIWKDHLPKWDSVAISTKMRFCWNFCFDSSKCSDLTRTVSKTSQIWNVPL